MTPTRHQVARNYRLGGPRVLIPHLAGVSDSEEIHIGDPSKIDELVKMKKTVLGDGVLAHWAGG